MIDSEIGIVADFIPNQLSSIWGISVFLGIAIIFVVSQYFILSYLKQINKENKIRVHHLRCNLYYSIHWSVYISWNTCICYFANPNKPTVQSDNTLCISCD